MGEGRGNQIEEKLGRNRNMAAVRPYKIVIPDSALAHLHRKLELVSLPKREIEDAA